MWDTVYPIEYEQEFVVFCLVVDILRFSVDSWELFTHIRQGYFTGTGAIVRLPQCQWSNPERHRSLVLYQTTTDHNKSRTIIFGVYCKLKRLDKFNLPMVELNLYTCNVFVHRLIHCLVMDRKRAHVVISSYIQSYQSHATWDRCYLRTACSVMTWIKNG